VDNAGLLTFPFKRYQIQKVWRGERPQEGRFREFIQADIDIVGDGALPLHHDVEVPLIMHEALSALPVPAVTIHVSNRKVAQGFYQSIGIDTDRLIEVLRVVDKLDKIGPEKVAAELTQSVGTTAQQAAQALRLATITGTDGQELPVAPSRGDPRPPQTPPGTPPTSLCEAVEIGVAQASGAGRGDARSSSA